MIEKVNKVLLFKIIKVEKKNTKQKLLWTKDEDSLLLKLVEGEKQNGSKINWKNIAQSFKKDYKQCYNRYRSKYSSKNTGFWTNEEEYHLIKLIELYGKKWSKISKELGTRSGKQIRHHYANITDSVNKKLKFTKEEDKHLLDFHNRHGSDWKLISTFFSGRSADNLKGRFNNLLNKKKWKKWILK